MSRVNIRDIIPGETLDVADVNDTVDSWVTATTPTGDSNNRKGVDSDNIRDEGLDRRMFTKGDVTPSSGRDTSGFFGNKIINGGSIYDGQFGILNAASADQIIGPLTYSPPPYDDHMLLVRYHMDIFAAPSESKTPSPGDLVGPHGVQKKTQITTRLAYILSASTPTNSSNWIPMPSTTRFVRMGPYGFHGPITESIDQFNINGMGTISGASRLFKSMYTWASTTGKGTGYNNMATIFAGKARLRQNICASHLFSGGSSTDGITGYSYTQDYTDQLYIGLQLKVDYWDNLPPDDAKVTIGNSRLHARTFVR